MKIIKTATDETDTLVIPVEQNGKVNHISQNKSSVPAMINVYKNTQKLR